MKKYNILLNYCVGLPDFLDLEASMMCQEPQTKDTKIDYEALNELRLNYFKKVQECENKPRRAVVQEELVGKEGSEGNIKSGKKSWPTKKKTVEARKRLIIYILDVGNTPHQDPLQKCGIVNYLE